MKITCTAVYGATVGNVHVRGLDTTLEDFVKIVLFMEPRAHNIYMGTDQVNQSSAQPDAHLHHPLANSQLPTPTGMYFILCFVTLPLMCDSDTERVETQLKNRLISNCRNTDFVIS